MPEGSIGMTTSSTVDRPPAADRDSNPFGYWLGHCEGFAVLTPEGRVGFVESVETDASGHRALVIAGGLFRPRRLLAEADDVVELDARRMRIVLAHSPRGLDDGLDAEFLGVTE